MSSNEIFYRRPGEGWQEGIPIGNGRLGGTVEGGVNQDHLFLNEETMWAGCPGDCERENPAPSVRKARDLVFAGKNEEARQVIRQEVLPEDPWFGSYQVLGELTIRMFHPIEYRNYDRRLFLKKGTVEVTYEKCMADGVGYKKEYLVSAVHQVLAIRYRSTVAASFSLDVTLSRQKDAAIRVGGQDTLVMEGQIGTGIRFAAALKAVVTGGTVREHYVRKQFGPSLMIQDATEVVFYVAANTSFRTQEFKELSLQQVEQAARAGWKTVKEEHAADYGKLYGDFDLDLDGGEDENSVQKEKNLTVWERLERVKCGEKDENLYALWVKYCRYLLISSSRRGCLPSNLQGIWNCQIQAPWESDFHANINLEVNYWPAALYGLAECEEPLFDFMKALEVSGRKTACKYYEARGWVLHHASNLFGHTAPCAVEAGYWPMGAAWLARHLFEHYQYTGDYRFLRETVYPLMKGAARFLMDFLVEIPKGLPGEGLLTTCPSHSPENRYLDAAGQETYFTYGASMDYEIIRDLLGLCSQAIALIRRQEETDFEKSFEREMEDVLARIPDTRISRRTGCIMEWMEDYEEAEPGHRHMSHLYGFYPARRLTLEQNPDLAAAAVRTLDRKLENHYDGQGWSYGWMACLRAVLMQGEESYEALSHILLEHMQYNLFVDAHGVPQAGDMQVIPMAILEMLIQLREEKLVLLPALPRAFKNGAVKGIHAKGGYVLDWSWQDGKIVHLRIDRSRVFCEYIVVDKNGNLLEEC